MNRTYWRVVALICTVGVVVLCFLPAKDVPGPDVPGTDKLFHFLSLFVVGYSWRRSGMRTRNVLLLGLALAVGTEVGQALLAAGRSADVLDATADLLGVALGAYVASRLQQR